MVKVLRFACPFQGGDTFQVRVNAVRSIVRIEVISNLDYVEVVTPDEEAVSVLESPDVLAILSFGGDHRQVPLTTVFELLGSPPNSVPFVADGPHGLLRVAQDGVFAVSLPEMFEFTIRVPSQVLLDLSLVSSQVTIQGALLGLKADIRDGSKLQAASVDYAFINARNYSRVGLARIGSEVGDGSLSADCRDHASLSVRSGQVVQMELLALNAARIEINATCEQARAVAGDHGGIVFEVEPEDLEAMELGQMTDTAGRIVVPGSDEDDVEDSEGEN
jgi:hypothetical protein